MYGHALALVGEEGGDGLDEVSLLQVWLGQCKHY
jgi:hypothetical protein